MKILKMILLWSICISSSSAQNKKKTQQNNFIVINAEVPSGYNKNEAELKFYPSLGINDFEISTTRSIVEKVNGGSVGFKIHTSESVDIYGSFWAEESRRIGYTIGPGETIEIKYVNGKPVFKGTAGTKFELIHLLNAANDSISNTLASKIGVNYWKQGEPLKSVEEYFIWNQVYNAKIRSFDLLLNRYRTRISKKAFNLIKLYA